MEIRHYEDIKGVVPTADVVEGRFGLLTSHSWDNDFGSDTDLPGFKVPATAAEATVARWCITWPVDNRQFPAALAYPKLSYSLRVGGFDQTANLPASLTLYGTNPANQEGLTIPSGYKSLAFRGGYFTLPSGCYIWNANLATPGTLVAVADTNTDGAGTAGKIKYEASMDADQVVGEVYRYDSTTGRLTVRITE